MESGMHHLQTRKHLYARLERYPSQSVFKRRLDTVMYVVALSSPLVLLPQVLNIFAEKNAAGFITITWILFIIIHALWILYGSIHREWPVVISHGTLTVLNIAILVGIYLY